MKNKFVILTTCYNCEKYIEKCLYSIMAQSYKNFTCYITDDLSTDNSVNIIQKIIEQDNRFKLIKNTKKLYQPGNYDNVLRDNQDINDNDICVEVDGDDLLPDNNVFERLNKTYDSQNVWIANGSFEYHDGRAGFARPLINTDNIRKDIFTLSHLRTWRTFLWRKILQEDLKDSDGEYYAVAGDLAFMFPMVEMAGVERYKFMNEINYIYNESNPLNDHKVNMPHVITTVNKIRNKNKYSKL